MVLGTASRQGKLLFPGIMCKYRVSVNVYL
jgi:hypothetical protein